MFNSMITLDRVIAFTAFCIAVAAAYFSVTGVGKLFAGAALSAMIMMGVLEVGKLVSVSFLYRYWKVAPKILRAYMTIGSVILMIITSAGIYGYLTAAYQKTADQLSVVEQQMKVVDMKKERFQNELTVSLQERDKLNTTIQQLSTGLANNVIQYKDQSSGQLITTTSSATRQALERQLQLVNQERDRLNTKIDQMSDSITSFDIQNIEISSSTDLASEIGPLKFVSELTNIELNRVVNWFVLLIVFVFDPLSVSLVLAYNFLKVRSNTKEQKETDAPEPQIAMISPTQTKVEQPTEVLVEEEVITPTDATVIDVTEQVISDPVHVDNAEVDLTKVPQTGLPYYMKSNFDWNNVNNWVNDQEAVNFRKFLDGIDK